MLQQRFMLLTSFGHDLGDAGIVRGSAGNFVGLLISCDPELFVDPPDMGLSQT